MRRIEFIAPVEAMRGNLSGKQSLLYADNDNPAWDAPDGRQYAKNYTPRFIGARRSKDGKTYFAVKTKSAVKLSNAFRTQNAILAASSVIANILMKDLSVLAGLQERYAQTAPEGWSFKRWLMSIIKTGLKNKQHFAFSGTSLGALFIGNPYLITPIPAGGTSIVSAYPKELLVKFWVQLSVEGIYYYLNGQKGIAPFEGATVHDVIVEYPQLNVLGLSVSTVSATLPVGYTDPSDPSLEGDDRVFMGNPNEVEVDGTLMQVCNTIAPTIVRAMQGIRDGGGFSINFITAACTKQA